MQSFLKVYGNVYGKLFFYIRISDIIKKSNKECCGKRGKSMNNLKIRQAIARHRLRYYEVAKELGISPFTLSVWLREELALERQQEVLKAIDTLVKQQEHE